MSFKPLLTCSFCDRYRGGISTSSGSQHIYSKSGAHRGRLRLHLLSSSRHCTFTDTLSFASLGDNIIHYLDYITFVSFSQIDLPSLKNALLLFFKSRIDFHDADIGEKEQSWADETLGLGAI